jgi:Protein of unknown function (DUF2815)
MQTSIVKDSEIGDAWIQQACQANPPQFVQGNAGHFTSGPVRLAFTQSLFTPELKPSKPGEQPRSAYSCAILFPPIADLSLFNNEWNRVAQSDFANTWNGAMFAGLDPPFRAQVEKLQYSGYTPGGMYINVSSNYKPPIVDARMNPIVDPAQVYAGCWAIVCLNTYASGKTQAKKGPRFGLQTIMKIADDKSLEGAGPDPKAMFAGAKITPPSGPVSQQFGQQPVQNFGVPPTQQFGQAAIAQVYGAPPVQQRPYDPEAAALAAMMGQPYP